MSINNGEKWLKSNLKKLQNPVIDNKTYDWKFSLHSIETRFPEEPGGDRNTSWISFLSPLAAKDKGTLKCQGHVIHSFCFSIGPYHGSCCSVYEAD